MEYGNEGVSDSLGLYSADDLQVPSLDEVSLRVILREPHQDKEVRDSIKELLIGYGPNERWAF